MTENLQDELYKLENKPAKGAKRRANIRSWRAKNASFKVLERQNMQNQTIFELYTDDNKSKYSSNPKDILKSEKKTYEKLYTKWTSTAATTEFFLEIPNRKKISNEHFNICEAEISLDEIIKSINSEIIKPQVMMALQQNIVNPSNVLAPVLLDVYDSWGKLHTMGVTYRTGIIFAICKRW